MFLLVPNEQFCFFDFCIKRVINMLYIKVVIQIPNTLWIIWINTEGNSWVFFSPSRQFIQLYLQHAGQCLHSFRLRWYFIQIYRSTFQFRVLAASAAILKWDWEACGAVVGFYATFLLLIRKLHSQLERLSKGGGRWSEGGIWCERFGWLICFINALAHPHSQYKHPQLSVMT